MILKTPDQEGWKLSYDAGSRYIKRAYLVNNFVTPTNQPFLLISPIEIILNTEKALGVKIIVRV